MGLINEIIHVDEINSIDQSLTALRKSASRP